ncbi:MAG: FkbM family methyltransferase [Bacteroidia bacterium]
MINLLKRLASHFPQRYQQELKRLHFHRKIKKGRFYTEEPEFSRLAGWIKAGDWVLDVGANIGHYTVRFSEIAGATGRVISLEPVPATFELLAANASQCRHRNISLLNVAASTETKMLQMAVPTFDTGLTDYYRAEVTEAGGELSVMSISIDSLNISQPVSLVKIDVEGHEIHALRGMAKLLRRDHPRIIVEGNSEEVAGFLKSLDYSFEELDNSPNRVFFIPNKNTD